MAARWSLPIVLAAAACVLPAAEARSEDGYRRILQVWAGGSKAAVRDLVELERRYARDLDALRRAQRRVLSELVQWERLGLVAVARLHQEAFRLHAAASGDSDFLMHAMAMSDRAVEWSLRAEGSIPGVRKTAALLLTAMAVELNNQRFVDAAAQRLRRAAALDPELAVAFEWGACAEERRGRLQRARELLQLLLELQPDNLPGRLRLAMVAAKLGDPGARGRLEDLVAGEDRSWVWIFATEELARDYARGGRTEDAIELLERAAAEFPDDQGLTVALAFLDRDRSRSRARLERLASRGAASSARAHYAAWQGLEAFEAVVAETLAEHRPHLERALMVTDPRR